MNKKATSVLVMIFELIAVIAVIAILIGYAKNVAESDSAIKTKTANDLKMMIDTLVGVPGEVIIEYPTKLDNLSLVLVNNQIEVFPTSEPRALKTLKKFYLPPDYSAKGGLKDPKRVCLEKKQKTITLRECTNKETTIKI